VRVGVGRTEDEEDREPEEARLQRVPGTRKVHG
jgi:hypothetical protein